MVATILPQTGSVDRFQTCFRHDLFRRRLILETPMPLLTMPANALRAAKTFCTREDGNIATFSIMLFSLMVMCGGLAVDLMRVESTRTSLQQTLDRCTLASAALRQTLDPEAVCRDYVAKAGLSSFLQNVTVTGSAADGSRRVQARAMGQQNNIFAPMIGLNTFPVPAASMAMQSVTNIEIVLVLDVSGSMSGEKIANLKTAAAAFVDTVTANNQDERVSIAIVPYNAQVNMPDYLISKYNAVGPVTAANANCLEIPGPMFASPGISTTAAIRRAVYADTAYGTTGGDTYTAFDATGNGGADNAFQFCNPRNGDAQTGALTENLIFMPSSDAVALKARINALYAGGNTSIALGMKWGLNLIDPGTRPVFQSLITEGHITNVFSGRPYDYGNPNAMKVIVLMTDGEHVSHRIIAPDYRGATVGTEVWRGTDGNYSIRHLAGRPSSAGSNEFWVPHRSEWRAGPWTGNTANTGTPTRLTWPEVWQNQRTSWVAWQFYARALGTDDDTRLNIYDATMSDFTDTYASVNAMNNRLQQSCNLARNNGVVVYGIAFEAPENGRNQIRNCSTTISQYFEAAGPDEIATAFAGIAAQISQLRLTQ
jgi:Putative Flp pilus-assembly TadE/G-like/von Willebrand factor type A domain